MNSELLFAQFERVADAPDAVGRLRLFILDLAVRGKLVPQDPNDEPASELLKGIAKEKARLGIQFESKELNNDEIPFVLPIGWAWSRVGTICTKTGSGSTPRGGKAVYVESGVPFLRSQNIYDNGLRLDDTAHITPDVHARMSGTAVKPADLLLNITGGSMGRCCLVPDEFGEANVSQHVAIIRAAVQGMSGFLHKLVLSPYFQTFIFGEQTGAGRGGLPKNRMDRIAVALPSLAEQHRIVNKVDELMALCDWLEATKKKREATRDRLTAASLARLNAPDPDPAVFADHARFALDALPTLSTRPDQIKQLRQTILTLAVRGKLVPQDPNDEPASELLKRIASKKARQMKSESKKPKVDPFSNSGDLPFSVPVNWCWSQIAEIGILSPRNEAPDATNASFVSMPLIAAEYGVENGHEIRPWGEIKKGYTHFAEGDVGLAKITPCFENGKSTVFRNLTGGIGSGTTELHIVRPLFVDQDYILIFFKSPHFIKTSIPKMTGTAGQKRVPTEYFAHSPFPLPPLAEQHRIVKKVDELMALCDRLEACLTTADETCHRLLEALLVEALSPDMQRNLKAEE